MARRKKNISIKHIAKEAEVSVATVSRVINNRTDVSEQIRARVRDVVSRYNFTPTKSNERRVNIGVIISTENPVVDEYIAQALDGVTRYSGESNLDATVVINCLSYQPKPLLQIIRERRCDAAVLITPEKVIDQVKDLEKAGIPTMLVNSSLKIGKVGYVNNESYDGAVSAINFLLQLGHRKIGFLCSCMDNNVNHHERLQGYRDAMDRAGALIDPGWIIEHHPTIHTPEAGYRETLKLLESNPEVTAIFASNDEMALGAIKACWDKGMRVPEDISIIGFDDIPFSSYMHPALSTVRQPLNQLGYRAIMFLDHFLKKKTTQLPCENLGTELVIRESTAAPRS